jgi:hypothetical protein
MAINDEMKIFWEKSAGVSFFSKQKKRPDDSFFWNFASFPFLIFSQEFQ